MFRVRSAVRPFGWSLPAAALLALLVWATSFAQGPSAPPTAPGAVPSDLAEEALTRAPVVVEGEVLFRVRGTTAYPAEQRAEAIRKRILAFAADRALPVEALRLEEGPDRTNLLGGDRLLLSVFEIDAALEDVPRPVQAEVIRTRIAAAVSAYRHARDPGTLMSGAAYALGATLVFAALLFGLRRAVRGLNRLVERRFKSRVEALEIQAHRLIQATQLWKAVRGFINGLYVLSALAAGYAYLELVLSLFPWTRPLAVGLLQLLLDPLRSLALGFIGTLPDLAFLAVLAVVTRYLLRLIQLFFEGVEQGAIAPAHFDRDWAGPTFRIVRLLLIAFAIVVAYPHIPGSESEIFKGLSIFVGLIFSLGSTSFVGNLIAGYAMIYSRALKVGDRIRINDLTGDVILMRPMVTHLRTIKNEEIVVPNSSITGTHVINYSTLARSRGLILHTTVGIGYETSWRQVEAILLLAADRTPGLLKTPAPFVRQQSLGDFSVTYELNAYSDNAQAMHELYSEMHRNVLDVFNEHGVQIMTPAYEGDPDAPKVVPKEKWFQPPAGPARPPAAGSSAP